MDWIQVIIALTLVFLWAGERFQFLSAETRAFIRRLVEVVKSPEIAKEIVKRSPEGQSSLLNAILDKEKPKADGTRRVSRKRAVGRAFLSLLPLVSRFIRL